MPHALTTTLAIVLALSSAGARAADIAPTLHTSAGDAPSACTGAGLAALRADVMQAAAGRAPQDAWRLAHALACARGRAAHRVIAAHLHGHVASRIEPGEPEISQVDANSGQLRDGYLKGLAWGARVQAKGDDLVVQFSTNAYCWAGATLRPAGQGWTLAELNGGCD